MNTYFNKETGKVIILALCDTIIENKAYLSEIDGLIGDGDHGINMAKGFKMMKTQLEAKTDVALDQGLLSLSDILMGIIGGSMGPLYGYWFLGMASNIASKTTIEVNDFADMLDAGLDNLGAITEAKVGDKCMMDTLVPAINAFQQNQQDGKEFSACLQAMVEAARAGCQSTKQLIAQVGRASRLGGRSVGTLDPGAISCMLLLTALAKIVADQLIEIYTQST
ncbi:MAG: dihydroxyacetone kinase subunit DhaL [Ostreibacterium sp.]